MVIQQKAGQLALTGADGIALIIRVLAEEHVKHQRGVLESVQEQAVCHCEFVKINDHCRVVVVLIRDVRHNFDLAHEKFPLFFTPGKGFLRPLPFLFRVGRFACLPVLTVRFYHDITKRRAVQAFLSRSISGKKKAAHATNSTGGFQFKRVNR